MRTSSCALILSFLLFQNPTGPAPRFDSWKILGPGGGGTMILPSISPHDPNLVVEGCDMTGMYITRNGGQSWRMFNLRDVLSAVTFDPRDPNVVYVGNDGLWRSTDQGQTWHLLYPDPARETIEHMRDDHAGHGFTTSDPSYTTPSSIRAIAVDPKDSRTIYLAIRNPKGQWLVLSKDSGKSWSTTASLPADRVLFLRADPASSEILVCTTRGLHLVGSQSREETSAPHLVQAAAGGSGAGLIVYGTGETVRGAGRPAGGVFVSEDRGKTWEDRTPALGLSSPVGQAEPPRFEAIACSKTRPEVAYVGFRGLKLDSGPPYNGIAKTTDKGTTWTVVKQESDKPASNSRISWVEERAAGVWKQQHDEDYSVWFDAPRDLAVAPGRPDVCYATDLFRTSRTTNGGRDWETMNSARSGTDRWTTRGLDVTTCYGVHFDPFDLRRMYISYTDIGLFRSEDRGRTWTGATDGIPREWRNTTYWIEQDPEVKGLIWGGFGANHDLPRPKMWRRTDPAAYKGGVATSTDHGRSWKVTDQGINQSDVTHIVMDPASPRGQRALYACGFGDGVFKSTDNGRTWSLKRQGLEGRQPFAWRIARAGNGTLYLVIARRSDDGSIGNPDDGALYRSADGAEHWERMRLPEGTNGPNGILVDPRDNRRLYLAAWGRDIPEEDQGGGIFMSEDAGQTWRNVVRHDQHIYDVTIDPRQPNVLYACGFEHGAYRSLDRGETWTRIKGYNFKWGHRVVPDPLDPAMIYITTFGGSVWYGPAAGDPNAREDVLTPLEKR